MRNDLAVPNTAYLITFRQKYKYKEKRQGDFLPVLFYSDRL